MLHNASYQFHPLKSICNLERGPSGFPSADYSLTSKEREFMIQMTDYEEAIRTRVCTACLERTGRGICGIGQSDDCALNRFLPDVIRMVNMTRSDSLDDHVKRLHLTICTQCKQTPEGFCEERDLQACALYEYLPLVIEAIEEVNVKKSTVRT